MLTKIKDRVESWLRMEAEIAYKAGLTPNHISLIGVLLASLSGIIYWISGRMPETNLKLTLTFLAPTIFLLSGFCDALDGVLARTYGKSTVFGGFLDSLLDRYADSVVYFGLVMGGWCEVSWGTAALIGSLLVSYVRAKSEAAGVDMETIGLAERAERIIIISSGSYINMIFTGFLNISIIILAVLTNLTVIQRTLHFYKRMRHQTD